MTTKYSYHHICYFQWGRAGLNGCKRPDRFEAKFKVTKMKVQSCMKLLCQQCILIYTSNWMIFRHSEGNLNCKIFCVNWTPLIFDSLFLTVNRRRLHFISLTDIFTHYIRIIGTKKNHKINEIDDQPFCTVFID